MAEENQNTEMEDILSSIKNILEENDAGQSQEISFPETDVSLDVSSEVDDILELSPDMRSEPEMQPTTLVEEVEIPVAEVVSVEPSSTQLGIEDETSDSVFDESYRPTELASENDSDDILNSVLNVEEPVLDTEVLELPDVEQPGVAEEVVADTPVDVLDEVITADVEAESVIEFEPEPVSEEVSEVIAEPVEQVEEKISVIEEEIPSAPMVSEIEPETVQSSETEIEQPKSNAVDVSAGIISNFAKMFAKEEHHEEVLPEAEPVKISAAGNTSKTLEEFVLDAIMKVIGSEIKTQWNNGSAFSSLAEAEIKRQTQNWINDNLPSLVEKIVKQEIERVIAKVGS